MKGTSFQKPLELSIRTEGESWVQGTGIQGTLEIRTHANEASAIQPVVHLAHGALSKVHGKNPKAFKILASLPMGEARIEPGTTFSKEWNFALERNSPISEKSNGVFLLYGFGEAMDKLGHLELNIKHEPIIEDFLKSFETHFRFVRKSVKWSKGWVEVKLAPPDSKAFSSLEHLALSLKFEGETLMLEYEFNVKKLEATAASAEMTKKKLAFEQKIESTRYRLPSGRIKTEEFESAIREALVPVESKVLF
jgi:hypothetical protein